MYCPWDIVVCCVHALVGRQLLNFLFASSMSDLPVIPFAVATLLAVNGARSGKLAPSGAATAFVVGFLVFTAPVRAIGISFTVFYLLASWATKCECTHMTLMDSAYRPTCTDGNKRKAQLEEGFQDAGYRSGWQVLCNSTAGFLAAIFWSVTFTPNVLPWSFFPPGLALSSGPPYDGASWCPLSATISDGLSRALLYVVLG